MQKNSFALLWLAQWKRKWRLPNKNSINMCKYCFSPNLFNLAQKKVSLLLVMSFYLIIKRLLLLLTMMLMMMLIIWWLRNLTIKCLFLLLLLLFRWDILFSTPFCICKCFAFFTNLFDKSRRHILQRLTLSSFCCQEIKVWHEIKC